MTEIGKINILDVVRETENGLYLNGENLGEILMPQKFVTPEVRESQKAEVFVYTDSEDRLVATTETPLAMVGDFVFLKVIAVSRYGAFLDWGLPKDLLVPFSEQVHEMEEGKRYVVGIYLDEQSNRIAASARLDDFLYDESEGEFETGEAVEMFIANKTELGYKVIINNTHWGLLHYHEVVRPLKRGEKLAGFIKHIREDGKIDLALHLKGRDKTDEAVDIIMKVLRREGGFLAVTDKSPAARIDELFGLSKSMYKKAVGSLFKRKMITIADDGIHLVEDSADQAS